MAFKITSYTKLQFFQYKFLHNILYTNYKLFRLKYVDSPMCSFWNTTENTILHLFCECKEVKNFWIDICSWISGKLKTTIIIASFDICFGYNIIKLDVLTNHLILIAKSHIYHCQLSDRIPTLSSYINLISTIRGIEKTIAFNNDTIRPLQQKMETFLSLLPAFLDLLDICPYSVTESK